MVIIIEGNELNFKTTVANKLAEKLGYDVVKGSSFEQSECDQNELFSNFFNMIIGVDNVIIDRYIYSNLTYAPLYDGFALLDPGGKRLIEDMMKISKARLVYLYTDTETLKERLRRRGDEKIDEDKLEIINEKFDEVMSEANYDFLAIDTNKFNSDQIVDMILNLN